MKEILILVMIIPILKQLECFLNMAMFFSLDSNHFIKISIKKKKFH